MSEKFPANFSPQVETDPAAGDSYETGYEQELTPELQTLMRLQEHFGDTIFYYKDYAGTVAFLFASACPAFPFVLGKGFDYAVGWLEGRTQPPNNVVEEEKPAEETVDKPPDSAKPDVVSEKADAEAPVADVVVEAKTDSSTQSPEATSAPAPSPDQAPPAPVAQAADMPESRETVTKSEPVQGTTAQAQKGSDASISKAEALPASRQQAAGSNEVISLVTTPLQPEIQPEVKNTAEAGEVVHDGGRSTPESIVVPEQVPDIEVVAAGAIPQAVESGEGSIEVQMPKVEDSHSLAVEQYDILAEPTPAMEIKEVVTPDDGVELEEVSMPELLTGEAITKIEDDELATTPNELYESEPEFETFETAATGSDLDDAIELVETQSVAEDESELVPSYEFAADEASIDTLETIETTDLDPAVEVATDVLEKYEVELAGPDEIIEQAMETTEHDERAEASEEITAPVEEIIELMVEITAEIPDTLPEIVPPEATERVSKVAQAIQKLEIARSAEQCHEALTEIRLELASLLRLLGYDNAEAIAERLVQQYDMATLKQYLAQLVRLLESRRSESTLTRQITPKPSHRLFGIHAVGRVVMLGTAAA